MHTSLERHFDVEGKKINEILNKFNKKRKNPFRNDINTNTKYVYLATEILNQRNVLSSGVRIRLRLIIIKG